MSPSRLEFLIPGDLGGATGGYLYDRRMIAGLRALGWQVTVHALDGSFPYPSAAALAHAGSVLAGFPRNALVLIDALALAPMTPLIEQHGERLALVALMHLPLAAEIGLAPQTAARVSECERRALRHVRHVVLTGSTFRPVLHASGVAAERCSIIEPGTDAAPLARRRYDDTLELLCVATVNPGKGHDLLVDALAPLARLPWILRCAGSLTRSPATVLRLREQLRRQGLAERVILTGEVDRDRLEQLYLAADLFVLPTRLESYGMAVAEALAHGLPVISTRTGAIAQLVGAEAGLLAGPGDGAALSALLARALSNPVLMARLAHGAAAVRARLPRWPQTCERMAALLQRITGCGGA